MTTTRTPGQVALPEWLTTAVPDWLAEVLRPRRAPVPWPDMLRSAAAICVPLSVAIAIGDRGDGVLTATGGLLGTMVDSGGPYLARVRRVATAGIVGGAGGLAIGTLASGRGWIAVVALVLAAGVAAVLATLGGTGSATGTQLLVYCSLSLGPLGALPWYHAAIGVTTGLAWALLLIVPGWLLTPRSAEQQSVAAVYHRLADDLRAIGTPLEPTAIAAAISAANHSYDTLLTARSVAGGRSRRMMRLVALLNTSRTMGESVIALRLAGERPPRLVSDTVDRLADAVDGTGPVPVVPPLWLGTSGAVALRKSMAELAGELSRPRPRQPSARPSLGDRVSSAVEHARDAAAGGWVSRTFAVRLMACIGIATIASEVLPLDRSYWVILTVAIVLKPDYGSVFARALQRGLGTVVGAVVGAAILAVVPYGPWLLIPMALFAALLPYGKSLSFGLTATFLTPLVVMLIDLLTPIGWRLAEDRLADTALGCAIVLVFGYAPWPSSWQQHLPAQFAATVRAVCGYMRDALIPADDQAAASPRGTSGPILPHSQRRHVTRALSDLRAEFQRTMSEPRPLSRQATAWWPAVVELQEVADRTTALALAIRHGATPPSPDAVRSLSSALRSVADAITNKTAPLHARELPDDPALKPLAAAVKAVLSVLAPAGPAPAVKSAEAPRRTIELAAVAVDAERGDVHVRTVPVDDLRQQAAGSRGEPEADVPVPAGDGQVVIRSRPPDVGQPVRRARPEAAPGLDHRRPLEPGQELVHGAKDPVKPPLGDRRVQAGQLKRPAEPQPVAERRQRDLALAEQRGPPRHARRRLDRDRVTLGRLQAQPDAGQPGARHRPRAGGDDHLTRPEVTDARPDPAHRPAGRREAEHLGVLGKGNAHARQLGGEPGEEIGHPQGGALLVQQSASGGESRLDLAQLLAAHGAQRQAVRDRRRHRRLGLREPALGTAHDQHAPLGKHLLARAQPTERVQAAFLQLDQDLETGGGIAFVAGPAEPPQPGRERWVGARLDVERAFRVHQPAQPVREHAWLGERRGAMRADEPGVAVRARLRAADRAALDDGDASAGKAQVIRAEQADDARADDEHVRIVSRGRHGRHYKVTTKKFVGRLTTARS